MEDINLIDNYPDGSDLTIVNNYYIRPYQKEIVDPQTGDTKQIWTKDYMVIVYRDNNTGIKKHQIIREPKYMYYLAKPNKRYPHVFDETDNTPYPEYFTYKDNVVPHIVKYRDLEKDIFENLGLREEYDILKANGDWKSIRSIHKDPRVFMSDMNIEDHYRFLFNRKYTNNTFALHKAFFDIEVDGKYQSGDYPELGECPINAISFFDDKENKITTFLLRDQRNPLISEFEKSISPQMFKEFSDFIIDTVGGLRNARKYNLVNTTFELLFFDKEIDLIKNFFKIVHKVNPDFCEGYNMSNFDMAYIIERVIVLGFDPTKILCNDNYPDDAKMVYHYIDERNKNALNKRTDFTLISGDVVWIDQLLQFAQKRSAKYGSFDSFKLDDIGHMVADVKKLDYHHITHNISELPYLNYRIFVLYNMMDTVVQHCIESKSKDLEYLFNKCLINSTTYAKAHRQTVYLINRFTTEYDKKGFVIGNNMNKDNDKPDKYAGALVGDPVLVNDYSKLVINGQPCMIFDNPIDEDFKALYPSCAMQGNMAPNTQIGLIEIPNQIWSNENQLQDENYWRASEFVDNLTSKNILLFANRWLGLANFKQFIFEDLQEWAKVNNIDLSLFNKIYDFKFMPFEYISNIKENPFIEVTSIKENPFIEDGNYLKEHYKDFIDKIKERL